ncbi:hypothetical protein D3OALGA1CA_1647 [Olavius algarvensis associated proteobacterium Delta 3]|nr:hypothetical protein D3OALGA1CA_1647 [Olavius algarvensis associated proteobacterium Delta 3]
MINFYYEKKLLLFRKIILKLSKIHKPSSYGKLDRQTACPLL